MTNTSHAIRIQENGGPEVMHFESQPMPTPGKGQVLLNIKAAGVNYIDIYQRSGAYPSPLPYTLGLEGAGIVEAVGEGVSDVKVGDHVAWTYVPGSYATHVIAPAEQLVPLPKQLSFEQGAAAMLQGMTVEYLVNGAYALKKGDTCLIHSAAGGTGLLLCQIAKELGAHVIGTVSTDAKAKLAKEAGADEVILYSKENFVERVMQLTKGQGVNVVYDGVGKDTFDGSMECLGLRGTLVSFGAASGTVPPFDIGRLATKSLFLTKPVLFHYVATRPELLQRSKTVFDWIIAGKLKLTSHTYPLKQAAEAHRDLAARKTTGKLLLIP